MLRKRIKRFWHRVVLAYYAFQYPNWADTAKSVIEQSKHGSLMGIRGTPIIGFYPARKWANSMNKQSSYWETEGSDGDALLQSGISLTPAKYRLVYFKIPGADLVCQLAYETSPMKASAWDDDGERINYVGCYELRDALLAKRAKPC